MAYCVSFKRVQGPLPCPELSSGLQLPRPFPRVPRPRRGCLQGFRGSGHPPKGVFLAAGSPQELANWLGAGSWPQDHPPGTGDEIGQLRRANADVRLRSWATLPQREKEDPSPADALAIDRISDELGATLSRDIEVPVNDGEMTAAEAWEAAKGQLRAEIPRATFDTWVDSAELLGYADGEFVIAVRNQYARDWLDDRLSNTIRQALIGITGQGQGVRIVVG